MTAPAGVPRLDVAAITDGVVRRRVRRVIERTMKALEGAFYVGGRYFASEADADLMRTREAERVMRDADRRERYLAAVPAYCETDWEAEYYVAAMDAREEAKRLLPVITMTVKCSWCEAEGVDPIIHAGNPNLPVSHGLCLRHMAAILGEAGCEVADLEEHEK